MQKKTLTSFPHRRMNILTGEWILVSPHRTMRPWQGEIADLQTERRPQYDPKCYLCPGNTRANGDVNPHYKKTFVFTNDFSALLENAPDNSINHQNLFIAKSEAGICRVVNFSPRHDLTLAEMTRSGIKEVIMTWQNEFRELGSNPKINHVQIFENKGAMMGNSNPHPHCQIWAQNSIPMEAKKETKNFTAYKNKTGKNLLIDYLREEIKLKERIVYQNKSFAVLVPFWAVWPYETIIIPKRRQSNILELRKDELPLFADAIKVITSKYDKLFNISFPYSSGIHQAPTDGRDHNEWNFHLHFYPPLLRSATIKKFMVGYEMMAEPQRDITPEQSAKILLEL